MHPLRSTIADLVKHHNAFSLSLDMDLIYRRIYIFLCRLQKIFKKPQINSLFITYMRGFDLSSILSDNGGG